ncbi:hypothetical protein PF005_g29783 [Phytophthora fragariae]|nr:hypothetical protein PF011_g28883 [Phytophthora fragariae]KAE9062325.1 hypothetical protein PF010_g29449 [Phytophthora fragariae]KAE9064019.1 hypothetical protein PF007_g29341 [Phytophthora fragariae]KAE9069664.1 hypothetical protein PF006_g29525 [Phytophthora fragariae]KAE9165023.1 hypothetical protein PF005_g29783 [Phytophthora fragariae]
MWISDLREQLRARQPGVAFKLKPPDRKTLCRWIRNAWEDTASSTIIAGFRKCGLIERRKEGDEEEPTQRTVSEDADDVVNAVLHEGLLDQEVGEFSLDDDFDDVFRGVALSN